ncbi:hypothetical protein RRG08_016232 [Elysia crispata]|uniref:Uncharacterized protein n=1 Tax=Elysia crispata TaxID=231223 RepID=A0AAE1DJL0_9GAST|nr:hypothetical protein RRG08_016232 [Elysia crispata]
MTSRHDTAEYQVNRTKTSCTITARPDGNSLKGMEGRSSQRRELTMLITSIHSRARCGLVETLVEATSIANL